MKYKLVLTELAEEHLLKWKKSGQKKTLQKIIKLFEELEEHPYTGTGQVEALKGNLSGCWSRIDKHSRLIYSINDEVITVIVVSMSGHYGDK